MSPMFEIEGSNKSPDGPLVLELWSLAIYPILLYLLFLLWHGVVPKMASSAQSIFVVVYLSPFGGD